MLHMTRRHGCAYASYFLRPALTPQHHITSSHLVAFQLISSYPILTHLISSYLILSHLTSAYLIFFHLISVDPILSHLISYEHANGRASEHASNTWANERANNRTSKQRMRERTSKRMVECATNQVAKWFVAILVQVSTSLFFLIIRSATTVGLEGSRPTVISIGAIAQFKWWDSYSGRRCHWKYEASAVCQED